MEFEFDKEMDALLRQATRVGETQINTGFDAHLDADEISIFAENALSDKAKPRVIKHLADCDRCRTILSDTIALNSEADGKAASLPVLVGEKEAVSIAVPWYKKLFATQNLAYGLGAMVLLFAGMLGFIAVQNSLNSGTSEMAKVSDNETTSSNVASRAAESADSIEQEPVNSNTSSDLAESKDAPEERQVELGTGGYSTDADGKPINGPRNAEGNDLKDKSESTLKGNRGNKTVDNVSTGQDKLKNKADEVMAEESDDRDQEVAEKSKPKAAPRLVSKSAPAPAPPPAKPASVARKTTKLRTAGRSVAKESKKKIAEGRHRNSEPSVGATSADAAPAKRKIGGKTFIMKNRVWYDSQYKGQKTTNVRRKTTAYTKLDSGLRSITNKLNGTVVLVWKSKAYRVD